MNIKGFEWDKGNIEKNWIRHEVTDQECEEVFFEFGLLVYYDKAHSAKENRYYALGSTLAGRRLFVAYTLLLGVQMLGIQPTQFSSAEPHRRCQTFLLPVITLQPQ